MMCGCYPIVYDVGGPAETLKEAGIGLTFSTLDSFVAALVVATDLLDEETRASAVAGVGRDWALSKISANKKNLDAIIDEIIKMRSEKYVH
jgi:glycosyltransferase involved in cell wall biosynthesis